MRQVKARVAENSCTLRSSAAPVSPKPADATRERADQLQVLLASISRRVLGATTETLDDVIQVLLEELARFIGADRCFLYRCSDSQECWEDLREWSVEGLSPLSAVAIRVPTSDYPWSARKMKAGEIVQFTETLLPAEAVGERNWLRGAGMGSAVVFPLIARGKLAACLGFNSKATEINWPQEDLRGIQIASELILQALDRQRAEIDLLRQADKLKTQNAVLQMIARGRPQHDVLTALAELIEKHCDECAVLLLIVPENVPGTLRPAARGARFPQALADEIGSVPIESSDAIYARCARELRTISTADLGPSEVASAFRGCAATPIISRSGAVLGALALYFADEGGPSPEIQSIVDAAADLGASAIDHWHSEERVLRHVEALSQLVAHAPVAVVSLNMDRIVTGWNPAAERIFGWPAEDAIGRTLISLIVAEDSSPAHDTLWNQVLGGATLEAIEVTRRRRDGTPVDLAYWISPLLAPGGQLSGAISFIADVTDQKRMKDQLLQSSRMESIGRLAGGVAHDFNNLLAVISGYSESMLRRTEADHPLRTHVEEIYRATARGAALTQQLLAFSRRQAVAPEAMDLVKSTHDVYGMLRRVFADEIKMVIAAPGPVMVVADAGQVEQVLVNLAINARDAMPRGGKLTLSAKLVTLTRANAGPAKPGKYGRLSVTDTGAGMDPETRARIFEPFFTTKGQPKEGGGTGLGLSIVYGIVQQSGGHINLRTAPGEGAHFDVFFPAAKNPK